MDKVVVDDWGQAGIGPLGALRAHVDSGRLSEANLHAELGQIVAGDRPGRERDNETISALRLILNRDLDGQDDKVGFVSDRVKQALYDGFNDPNIVQARC